jgi:hypothetical protein
MPIKQRRFKLGVGLCAYCGVVVCTDGEDPIPRSLYPKSIRQGIQFLKIPACSNCNNAKSQVDDDLRDYLTINFATQTHPAATQLFHDTVIRAAEDNHIRLLDRFYEGKNVGLVTPSGFLFDLGYEVPFDDQPIVEAVKWLTRGMHWAVYGETVDAGTSLVWRIPDDQVQKWAVRFHGFSGKDFYIQGEPYTCGWVKAEDGRVLWAHSFFDSALFMAITEPRNSRAEAVQSQSAECL